MDDSELKVLMQRRNLTHISGDQKALLDRNEAWYRPVHGGSAHVPDAILDGVTEAWKRSKHIGGAKDRIPESGFAGHTNGGTYRQSSPPWLSQPEEEDSEEDPEAEAEEQVSIPEATVHEPPSQKKSLPVPAPRLARVTGHDMEDDEEDDDDEQEQEESEQDHDDEHITAKDDKQRDDTAEEEEEEEEEEENSDESQPDEADSSDRQQPIPLSQTTNSQPKKRSYNETDIVPDSAQMQKSYRQATPPCAQRDEDMVPNTLARPTTPVQTNASAGDMRRKRMKPITFSDIDDQILHAADTSITTRMAATKPYIEAPSSNFVSSSVIPATYNEKHVALGKDDIDNNEELELQSSAAKTAYDVDATIERIEAESLADDDFGHSPLQSRRSEPSFYIPNKTISADSDDVYTEFCHIYPDYITAHRGSLTAFVNACVYLQYLTSERLLRDCLFDDFIRAFSGGYHGYVAMAGAGQEPLPALEWFSNLSGRPVYNFYAVSRQNLERVVQLYPEQSRAAKALSGRTESPKQPAESVSESEPEPTPRPSVTPRNEQVEAVKQIESLVPEQRTSTQHSTPQKPLLLRRDHTDNRQSQSPIVGSASPELGSLVTRKRPASSATANPSPPSSRYMDRLVSSSMPAKSAAPPKRSAAEQARLREHFRNRKLSGKQAPRKS